MDWRKNEMRQAASQRISWVAVFLLPGKSRARAFLSYFRVLQGVAQSDEESFVSLHRLTADNGKRIIDEIVHQIDQIITTIEMVGSPAKPKRQAFRIKRKDSA
jgi:hypothetical protein